MSTNHGSNSEFASQSTPLRTFETGLSFPAYGSFSVPLTSSAGGELSFIEFSPLISITISYTTAILTILFYAEWVFYGHLCVTMSLN
jgi:hypothetical protein